jgi:hypothetical protein
MSKSQYIASCDEAQRLYGMFWTILSPTLYNLEIAVDLLLRLRFLYKRCPEAFPQSLVDKINDLMMEHPALPGRKFQLAERFPPAPPPQPNVTHYSGTPSHPAEGCQPSPYVYYGILPDGTVQRIFSDSSHPIQEKNFGIPDWDFS